LLSGIDLILGLNGLVWVSPHVPRGEDGGPLAPQTAEDTPPRPSAEARVACCRVAMAVRALAKLYLAIVPLSITDAYQVRGRRPHAPLTPSDSTQTQLRLDQAPEALLVLTSKLEGSIKRLSL